MKLATAASSRARDDRYFAQRLSEAELGRLGARLAANTHPEALSLEAVDGLFCALVASPLLILPHEYMSAILGGTSRASGPLEDLSGVQELLAPLIRHWNTIAHDLEHDTLHARLGEPGPDRVPGRAWARGYMRGIRLAVDGWRRILHDRRDEIYPWRAIPLVAGEVYPDWPKEPLTPEQADELRQLMRAGAALAYRYFAEDRLEQVRAAAERSQPLERIRPKIGRNEPCSCGSGKKYKRCCGSEAVVETPHRAT